MILALLIILFLKKKEEYKDIIAWDSENLRIEIKDRESLVEEVLPQFFSHQKYATFIRQVKVSKNSIFMTHIAEFLWV